MQPGGSNIPLVSTGVVSDALRTRSAHRENSAINCGTKTGTKRAQREIQTKNTRMFTVAWPCNAGLTSWSAERPLSADIRTGRAWARARASLPYFSDFLFSSESRVLLASKRGRWEQASGAHLVRARRRSCVAETWPCRKARASCRCVSRARLACGVHACRPSSLTRVSRALAENGQGGE